MQSTLHPIINKCHMKINTPILSTQSRQIFRPPHQNQYHSRAHTLPDKCDAINAPPNNQQVPHENQYKNNGNSTSSSDSLFAAALLWLLLLKNWGGGGIAKKITSPKGNTWEALQCVKMYQEAQERVCYPFKVLTPVRAKIFDLT